MMSNSENIHIKLQIDNSYRRFFVHQKITFSELKNKISSLLGLNSDFLIKYLDEENEWITINSDMELETGLTLYTEIFRILIERKDTPLVIQSQLVSMPSTTLLTSDSTPLFTSETTIKTDTPMSLSIVSPPVENSSVTNTTVVDETVGTADEKPWRKHLKNKEHRKDWKDKKEWKNEKKKGGRRGGKRGGGRRGGGRRGGGRRGGRKQEAEEDNSTTSSSFEDEGLSVDEAKKLITSLSDELSLLIEKKKALKDEVGALKESIRNDKDNNTLNADKTKEVKNQLKEKKDALKNVMMQIRSSKNRIARLREVVLTTNNESK